MWSCALTLEAKSSGPSNPLHHQACLEFHAVRFGFSSRPNFLGPVEWSVHYGDFWSVVGPNGSGKTTLIRLAAGLYRSTSGQIRLNGRDSFALSARSRAQLLAYVPQHIPYDLDAAAREIVLLGRFPHRTFGLFESQTDYEITQLAMNRTRTATFADRLMRTLSGGEAQRIHIAAGLAQRPRVMLLDEPTASLDIPSQHEIFGLLRDFSREEGVAVVAVTHDVNLAARFCSHTLLLDDGRVAACGPTGEALRPELLSRVYGARFVALRTPEYPELRWIVPA